VNPLSEGVRNGLFEGIAKAEADNDVVGVVVTGK
jgi:enoyl-CoA hydratase/carnithine racemase